MDGGLSPEGIWAEWEVHSAQEGDRTWIVVRRNGWVVAECYHGSAGWRRSRKPSEEIPVEVYERLPQGAQEVIGRFQ